MCPACLSTLALIAAGAGSSGGLVTLLALRWRGRRVAARGGATETPGPEQNPR